MPENEIITSRSNSLIKQARALRQRKARMETGLFLIEGIRHVGAALEADWDVDTILYSPDLLTSGYARGLISASVKKAIHCQSVSREAFESLAGKDNPQGIIAVARQRHLLLDDLSPQTFKRGVAIISPQDPGNVGTILRTLDASGADVLFLLGGGVDLYHTKVVRASMGALFWKPVVRASFDEFVAWAKDNACKIIGTSARGTTDYKLLKLDDTAWILLLGSEQKGLSDAQVMACDALISLPMRGRGSSLNLAVAAGILLYGLGEQE